MADLDERFAHWDKRQGLIDVGRVPASHAEEAIARSLATMHQAVVAFERVKERLGDLAYLDPAGGEVHQVLFVRDRERPEWMVPKPLVHLAFVQTSFTLAKVRVAGGLEPETAPQALGKPDIVPRGADMRLGSLSIQEGQRELTTQFDERGMRAGGSRTGGDGFVYGRYPATRPLAIDPTSRPPTALPIGLLLRADLDRRGHPPEALAHMILDLDPMAEAPGRVRVPAPLPCGAAGAWAVGLAAIRDALFRGDVPASARIVIADGLAGTALGWGTTRDEALAAWEAALFRAKPRPPRPLEETPPPAPSAEASGPTVKKDADGKVIGMSTGMITLSFGGGPPAVDWPAAVPKNMPAVEVPLPPLPEVIPEAFRALGFTRWVRVVGALGAVSHALLRDNPRAITLIGERALDLVDAATLDDELAEALGKALDGLPDDPEFPHPEKDPRMRFHVANYSLWDHGHQRRCAPEHTGGSWTPDFAGRVLDGDAAQWGVTGIRRLRD